MADVEELITMPSHRRDVVTHDSLALDNLGFTVTINGGVVSLAGEAVAAREKLSHPRR